MMPVQAETRISIATPDDATHPVIVMAARAQDGI
jgi:hypothetical protein